MNVGAHRSYTKNHGLLCFLPFVVYRIVPRILYIRALKGFVLTPDTIDPVYLKRHPECRGNTLSGSDIKRLSDTTAELPAEWLREAEKRGDWLYVFWNENRPTSFGCYTALPCSVSENVVANFSRDYLYMYNGFTISACRGQRLHAYGMAHALKVARNLGFRGLITFVEVGNQASIKSVLRLGYKAFGTCFIIRILGRTFTSRTSGCDRYGSYLSATVSGQ